MCRLISKHPFRTNPKIYNHVCTRSFTQLHKQNPTYTSGAMQTTSTPLFAGGSPLGIPLPWEMWVIQLYVCPCCSLQPALPMQGRTPLRGHGHTLGVPACCPSLAGCHFPRRPRGGCSTQPGQGGDAAG